MATEYVYGPDNGLHWRSYLAVAKTQTATGVSLELSGGFQSLGWAFAIDGIRATVDCETGASFSGTGSVNCGNETKNTSLAYEAAWTWKRTHVDRECWVRCKTVNSSGYMSGTSTTDKYFFTVPALDSYAVRYDANGGSGAPGAQTKWYGETLTLSGTRPTRAGHEFVGWATSAGGSVAYAAGASYTANKAATLYAVWRSVGPVVEGFRAFRSDASGTQDDDGTYVTFDATVECDSWSATATRIGGSEIVAGVGTGSGGIVGGIVQESAYRVEVTYHKDAIGETTVTATVTSSYFPMDFSPDGGIGIGKAAPDAKRLEVGIPAEFGASVTFAKDGTAKATVASGWKLSANNLTRKGDLVHAQIYARPTASTKLDTTDRTICTLPAGFRPKTQMWVPVLGTDGVYALLGIGSGGAVTISRGIYPGSSAWTTVTTSYTFWITVSFMAG